VGKGPNITRLLAKKISDYASDGGDLTTRLWRKSFNSDKKIPKERGACSSMQGGGDRSFLIQGKRGKRSHWWKGKVWEGSAKEKKKNAARRTRKKKASLSFL